MQKLKSGSNACTRCIHWRTTNSLKEGNSVALVGFGTFSVKERAARTGRNLQTGAEIQIAAATIPS